LSKSSALYALVAVLLLSGCVSKVTVERLESSKGQLILIKTPKIKYFDAGFVKKHKDGVVLEIYQAGNPIAKFETNKDTICINGDCYTKEKFVREFFHISYPKELFELVVLGEPLTQLPEGARYKSEDGEISFSDPKNGIKIEIKGME